MPAATRIAILTFDGFNEIDSFVALGLIGRLRAQGFQPELCGPGGSATSMNGVQVQLQRPVDWANEAEVVLFGSGLYSRAIAENSALLDRLQLDPVQQLIGAQCSGVLLLARLGLLGGAPACTDSTTRPFLIEAGVRVLEDEAFHARGPVATAGGCLAAPYLAAWVMYVKAGEALAREALGRSAPVGEQAAYVERLLGKIRPFVPASA
ncbi:DJ-1/PfpI family protein [Pelomonas sp. V22]|uniref:DJ-1/PfpI family protein n=1 Tax=Pelomonas sp. V22 TaxID=2822139 RepID=UPI0024A9EFCE|nr:DJ-1/PfpI family protein [Pelomonas sp. V22]MDI4635693.1 DJ-1/PfpI family protein [Pelomonas sp. V22]